MVEPRLIHAPLGCVWVGQRLYADHYWLVYSRREDSVRLGKVLLQSTYVIVIGSQLILQGPAKIIHSAAGLIRLLVICSLKGLHIADKVLCMVEQTIIVGNELLDYSRKIIVW